MTVSGPVQRACARLALTVLAALSLSMPHPSFANPATSDPVVKDQLDTPAAVATPAAPASTSQPAAITAKPAEQAEPALPKFSLPAAAPTTDKLTDPPTTTGALPSATPATTEPAAAPATSTPSDTTPAVPAPASDKVEAAAPPAPTADPVLDAVRKQLAAQTTNASANHPDDLAAVTAFYNAPARTGAVWIKSASFTDAAKSLRAELGKADDWGLQSSAYAVGELPASATAEQQADAEIAQSLAALRYARHARSGRIDPRAISNIWDVGGEAKDPAVVLADLSSSSTPETVLRGLHPQHPDFEALRQALLKARGTTDVAPPPVDEALLVKLPVGKQVKSLKVGDEHDDVVLLRKRLKIAVASGGNERIYDETLVEAVRGYQSLNGIKSNGVLNSRTRQVLNDEGEPEKPADKAGVIDNLIVNMERWRWLPADMGAFYVWNNVPEFTGRVISDGKPVFEERIIVGQPSWPTPMLTDSMEKVVFNPEWGMPDGIKMKELLPRLRRAGGNDFFSQLFGGGSSGGGRVLAAYGLRPSLNGRPVDPNSIDWNSVDIRRYSFVQPAGATNPLGKVKFMFPNRHDVYMHDTSQRPLFAQSRRALSHGCIRVQNPEKLAFVLLSKDKNWTEDDVSQNFRSGGEVPLDKAVPVYLTYFTARPNADGTIKVYSDIYGNDQRVLSALAGRPVRYQAPDHSGEEVYDDATVVSGAPPAEQPQGQKKQRQAKNKKQKNQPDDLISNALSGLLFN